jgi:cell division protein FtsB
MPIYDSSMRRLSSGLMRQWPSLIFAIILIAVALDGLCASSGPRDLLLLRLHSRGLTSERNSLVVDNAAMRDRIVRLRSDDAYLQQLIRQELGYARPGEFVYRFPRSEAP